MLFPCSGFCSEKASSNRAIIASGSSNLPFATTAPVWIAPAMNVHMYENKIVQKNMMTLKTLGYTFIEPGEGFLACGYVA
ncbi:flavoprotein, partial [Bacillus sp. D-CC]